MQQRAKIVLLVTIYGFQRMCSRHLLRPIRTLRLFATESGAVDGKSTTEVADKVGTDVSGLETERVINISRLSERHRLIAEGKIPPVSYEWEKEKWGKRMRFGKYGIASGVCVADLWPSVEEVEEEEAFRLYKTFSEVAKTVRAEAEAAKVAAEKRLREVAANEAVYEERLKKYQASLEKVEKAKSEDEEKLEKRILEIQEYFGYRINPKDPRFEVMFAQKEAEEKKAAKEAKRLEKQQKTVAAVAGDRTS